MLKNVEIVEKCCDTVWGDLINGFDGSQAPKTWGEESRPCVYFGSGCAKISTRGTFKFQTV